MNIWQTLAKPIFALAPMEDVTDTVFRRIVNFCARPDVSFTEFTNVEGMHSRGRDAIIHRLKFSPDERPIIAQIWGTEPADYKEAAVEIAAMGFDGIDINMGCPIKDVTSHGACAALINNPTLAKEIILATKEGAESASRRIPVSVKTRIGFKNIVTEKWISHILSCGIAALTVHGRTASEMSKVPAHWDEIGRVVAIKNSMKLETVILGNGDIASREDAIAKIAEYGVDGVMVGRAIFDDPWLFDRTVPKINHTNRELLELMRKHVQLFETTWGPTKNYAVLKKFYKVYIKGFDGASEYRMRAMETREPSHVYPIIDGLLKVLQ